MESYSLFQLNEYIRRVVALNFREPLWIEAEIAQVNDSRGNQYIELIEKDDAGEAVVAQISAVIWYRNYKFIEKKIGELLFDLLEEGTQVRVKCVVDYHERYGLKLKIEDIDPNYTFGKLELKRQEIINRLESEGLLELNKALIIPSVIQKIAVISSAGAAGYQDFKNQLLQNAYGYTFKLDLYDCAVQGVKVESETKDAIAEIIHSPMSYDIVAIIRGGGSKLDLSGYDNYEIAKDIALSEVPFIIGIGHDIDSTVTDMVACLSLKTPTAVADYIVDRNMTFEARVESQVSNIYRAATAMLKSNEMKLTTIKDQLSSAARYHVQSELGAIKSLEDSMSHVLATKFLEANHLLERMSLMLDAKDPATIMSQGYGFITKNKEVIKSKKQLKKGDPIDINLIDGSIKSKIL